MMRPLKLRPEVASVASRQHSVTAPQAATYALTGHSGASVVLHSTGSGSFVRKTAANAAASARLRAQAEKQRWLWMMGVPVPKVLQESEDQDGRASFDMTYVPGRTLANAVSDAAPIDSQRVASAVERLTGLFLLERGGPIAESRFRDKIDEIAVFSRSRVTGPALATIESCASRLTQRDWRGIPQSPCHGDLSLENILLTAGKSVAFIDCDNPWISSVWLDFGKLFQDIHGHWCIRDLSITSHSSKSVNARQKLEQLRAPFLSLASAVDPALPERLPQLAALCLLRAVPYSRDPKVVTFLCHRIQRVLED